MAIEVEAVYENGMLKLEKPLPLREHQKVKVTIEEHGNWVDRTQGILRWTGSHEDLRRLAEDVEFDPQEDA